MNKTITKTEITANGTRIDTYADGSHWVNMDRVLQIGIHRVLHRFSYRLSEIVLLPEIKGWDHV